METFAPNRSLLNPKFEGYKLDPIPQENTVIRYNLQHIATQSTTSTRATLSFQDVQSRITHNHLSISTEGTRALYIDAEYNVVAIDIDPERFIPECRRVYGLPKPISSPAVENIHPEYPSAAFLTHNTAFVSDGHGCMYILDIPAIQGQPAQLIGQYKLPDSHSSGLPDPFRIHNAIAVSPERAIVLLSSKYYGTKSADIPAPKARTKRPPAQYDAWAVQFKLPLIASILEDVQDMSVLWRRRGDDVPVYTAFDDSRKTFLLIGSSLYRELDAPPMPPYEPSPDEIAPIPRKDEVLDSNKGPDPNRPPPYSWTQTPDSVTVAFPLPSTTSKSSIKVTFSAQTITLHVQGGDVSVFPLPHYSLKRLWDRISPSSSFWTWDREAEHSFGLLTLHLDKQHEGTRWMQVFASAGTLSSAETHPDDVEVPETLDPSELGNIRETLEKYTSSVREGGDASGLGLGMGIPSLAEGEMDDEVDASVGRKVYLTIIDYAESTPPVLKKSQAPFTLLSTTLPGGAPTRISLAVKNNLDGTVFQLSPASSAESALIWKHTSTFSALAFVLASKRDTRFTYHLASHAVLAFESGSRHRGGNVYIYRGARTNDKWAKQAVLKVSDGEAGSLLGVGAVRLSQRKRVVCCLTEKQLILIHNII